MAAKRVNAKKNVMDRISIQHAFLNRIVTDEEEWVTYDNVNRKRT